MANPLRSRSHLLTAMVLMLVALSGCQGDPGPKRSEVNGIVLVNGNPAGGMLIQLQRQDAGTGNDQYPSCISNSDGRFQFGGTASAPGLIDGNYVATFAWLEGKDLAAKDKLQGKFSDATKSPYRLKVPGDNLAEIKFDLKQSR